MKKYICFFGSPIFAISIAKIGLIDKHLRLGMADGVPTDGVRPSSGFL